VWCNRTADAADQSDGCAELRPFSRSWLPGRYTARGHVEWIRRTLGVDRQCRVVESGEPILSPLQKLLSVVWDPVPCGNA
jgi:hypothetical protein